MKKTEFTWATHCHFSGTASKVLRADWFNLSGNEKLCCSSKTKLLVFPLKQLLAVAQNEVVFLP